ncbi:MAG TPA: FtsQ-type POTRA domain-containing protein [Candidatus Limnocylindrales bacterium]|nr:FtsQ-type POTRA domain-containing protein [Candidatus Limnocylindrales bacterium]
MDVDVYPQEVLADEEPKYLRRQKPLEIKRRKFGRRAWKSYFRVTVWVGAGIAGAWLAYVAGHFLLTAPQMQLIHPEQVAISASGGGPLHYVSRASVLEIFAADRGKSILRVPIDQRRSQLESLSWVEHAVVRRALPNGIEVEIAERVPVAFLRQGSDMSLIDLHGVILDRPLAGNFHFPVVTGITADMPQDEREKRMQLFSSFSQQVEEARAGAMDQVSEVDLSDGDDLTATIAGLQGGTGSGSWGQAYAPILVRFGNSDFESKYRTLLDDIAQWRATAGRVDSVDLRFSQEAVVNPDTSGPRQVAQQRPSGNEVAVAHPARKTAVKRAR